MKKVILIACMVALLIGCASHNKWEPGDSNATKAEKTTNEAADWFNILMN